MGAADVCSDTIQKRHGLHFLTTFPAYDTQDGATRPDASHATPSVFEQGGRDPGAEETLREAETNIGFGSSAVGYSV